jgi:U3 small nucleolar RNA-associated protein 22
MRREEFEDDEVTASSSEEDEQGAGGADGSTDDDDGAPSSSPASASQEEEDDDDDMMEDDEEEDDESDDDEDDEPQRQADPRFQAAGDDDDDDDDASDDSDGDGGNKAAPKRRRHEPRPPAARHQANNSDNDEEQRAMLAGELTPEEALLRVEARELAAGARRQLRRREKAAGEAAAALLRALRASMPADGRLPADARALAGGFMDALLGREAADLVARSAAAPPPAGAVRVGAAALGAALAERLAAGGGAAEAVVVVDVALVLPAGVLAHKDHVGYRYHARRAVYLAAVAAHLSGGGGAAAGSSGGGKKKKSSNKQQPGPEFAPSSYFRGWRQQWVPGGAGGGDPTLPRLMLWPPSAEGAAAANARAAAAGGLALRVTAVPPSPAVMPPHRLHPDRNNVRWVAKPAEVTAAAVASPPAPEQQQQQQCWLPTPGYNAALLLEAHALAHASELRAAFGLLAPSSSSSSSSSSHRARAESMADAFALLQLWARRAGVAAAAAVGGAGSGAAPPPAVALAAGGFPSPGPARCPDGLSDHFLAMLLAHCCGVEQEEEEEEVGEHDTATPPPPLHPLQALRAALRALADPSPWCGGKGVSMARRREGEDAGQKQQRADPDKRPPGAKPWARRHEVAFVARDGWCNLAAGVSAGALAQASAAARRALALLERPAAGSASQALECVFMDAPPTAAAFDYVWRVRMPPLRVRESERSNGGEGNGAAATASAAAATSTTPPAPLLGSEAGRAGLLLGAALHAHAAGDVTGGLAREQERRAEGWARRALGDRAALLRALAREPPALPRRGPCEDASRVLGDGAGESMFLVLPERVGDGASKRAPPHVGANGQGGKQGKNRRQQQQEEDDDDGSDDEGDADPPNHPTTAPVLIACVADPGQASRLVDVGPSADDAKQATRFRALWGARAELRRLADGQICESVSWAADVGADARHAVPDLAVAHVLGRHLPAGTEVVGCASALDPALRLPEESEEEEEEDDEARGGSSSDAPFEDSDAAAMRAAEGALERLARALRSLPQGQGEAGASPGIPLRVVAALPASAAAGRRTLPFPPRPHPLATPAAASATERPLADLASAALGPAAAPFADAALGRRHLCKDAAAFGGGGALASAAPLLLLPRCLADPIVVVAQLEGSGRWPEEPRAFAKMKLAMAAQLAQALARAHPGSCARASAVELDVGAADAQGAAAAAGIARAGSLPAAGSGDASSWPEEVEAAGGAVELLWEGFAARVVLQTDRDAAAKQRAFAVAQAFAASASASGGGNNPAAAARLLLRPDLLRLRAPPEPSVATSHHGLVAAVAAAHPAFAPTCRLAARWVGCQLLGGGGSEGGGLRHEAVELLVAAVFGRAVAGAGAGAGAGASANCGATGGGASTAALCAAPASRVAGFLRFLRLVEHFPWQHRPLVVDPLGELAAGVVEGGGQSGGEGARRTAAAEAALAARRQAAANLREAAGARGDGASRCTSAMFIATPRDMEISYW